MKTNLTPDEFVAVLASVCHIVEVLAMSKNYQDLLSHPRYSSTEFTDTIFAQTHKTMISNSIFCER